MSQPGNSEAASHRLGKRGHKTASSVKKAGRRAACPWINQQIIAVAELGDLGGLITTIEVHLPQMNLVNVSTALHRLAKLAAVKPEAQVTLQHHPIVTMLLEAARATMDRSKVSSVHPQCQALSNIAWSFATLQRVDIALLQEVAAIACEHLSVFKPFELSMTLWAFAKLSSVESSSWNHCQATVLTIGKPFFAVAAGYMTEHTDQFSFRCLVMSAWAFATANHHDSQLFRGFEVQLLEGLQGASSQELSNVAWAFGTAGAQHHTELFDEIARCAWARLSEFKPQELSSLLWGFASSGFYHEALFANAALVLQRMEMQAQQLSQIIWAYCRLQPHHPMTRRVVLTLLPRCTRLLATFQPQELSSVALALGRCFGPLRRELLEQLVLPLEVSSFFVAALPHVVPQLCDFSGQSLADVAASYVALQLCSDDSRLYSTIGWEVINRAQTIETSALLLLLRCLPSAPRVSSVQAAICALFAEAGRRIDELQPKELQYLSYICSALMGSRRATTIDGVNNQRELATRREIANCCARFAEAGIWMQVDLPPNFGVDFDETLGDEEINGSETIQSSEREEQWSYFTSSEDEGEDLRRRSSSSSRRNRPVPSDRSTLSLESPQAHHWNCSIKNTFVHVDDGDSVCESTDCDSAPTPTRLQLPPPLDFLPQDVSLEKLTVYRMNYQRFRTGTAVGAKGELAALSDLGQ